MFLIIELILYLVVLVAPISMIVHEFGHMFGAKLVKAEKIHVNLGHGKLLSTFTINNILINVHLFSMIGAYTMSYRKIPYRAYEKIVISIMGPLFSAVFAIVCYILCQWFISQLLSLFFLFNVWLAISNIVPFKIGNKQSDGYTVYKIVFQYLTNSK